MAMYQCQAGWFGPDRPTASPTCAADVSKIVVFVFTVMLLHMSHTLLERLDRMCFVRIFPQDKHPAAKLSKIPKNKKVYIN